jgi:hypothetical protein
MVMNYQNIYSPWMLWKWGIFFYEMTFTFEIIITLFFWAVLFPLMKDSHPFDFIDHITPIVILLVDYSMSRIPFSNRHLPLSIIILLIYGLINMTWTLVTGHPVYPVLDFKGPMTAVWALLVAFLEIGGFYLMTFLTNIKLKKVHQLDVKKHTQLNQYEVNE